MKSKATIMGLLVLAALIFGFFTLAGSQQSKTEKPKMEAKNVGSEMIGLKERGEYLVTIGDCTTCHSPKTAMMPVPVSDQTRFLSGHPANVTVPTVPYNVLSMDGWAGLGSSQFTAWGGPWGVSFAANLTPDMATGTGAWTEDTFIQAMRTGKHMGAGRDIMPPMPWYALGKAKDSDLKAIFAYVKSLPAIANQVPQPIPPPQPAGKP